MDGGGVKVADVGKAYKLQILMSSSDRETQRQTKPKKREEGLREPDGVSQGGTSYVLGGGRAKEEAEGRWSEGEKARAD